MAANKNHCFSVMIVACLLLSFAWAQPVDAETELQSAVEALENATSYRFEYSISPNADATSLITGEGEFDRAANAWRYTVTTDPTDPKVDHSVNGEWISVNYTSYHNNGNGWTSGAMDFTPMGIGMLPAPFMSYSTLEMLGSEDTFTELTWLGREVLHGVDADHYRFSTKDMPVYGTAQFGVWIAKEAGTVTLVVLAVTPEGKLTNEVVYSRFSEPVSIEAPN